MIKKHSNNLEGGNLRMAFQPTAPAYSGDGISIWEATTSEGKPYLKVKVLGGKSINCFKVEKKKED